MGRIRYYLGRIGFFSERPLLAIFSIIIFFEMFATFVKIFHQNYPFEREKTILVGVSGGPDSLALMSLLVEAGQKILVVHVNHQLRPEAEMEEKGVIHFAKQFGVTCITGRVDPVSFAEQKSLTLEEAARILRYRFLFNEAERHHAAAVAVAHNADDQVETFLLHLLRGTGTNGLRGMKAYALPNAWSTQIPLIRPLLGFWRSDILDYLASKDIHPFWDQSNWDNQYTRNRIRNQLIPELEEYNPAIRKLIWQTCAILDSDMDIIEKVENEAWEKVCLQEDKNMLELDLVELKNQPLALQRRIVRRAWLKFTQKPEMVDFEHIQQLIDWLKETQSGKWELSPDLTWFNESKSALIVRKGYEQKQSPYPQLTDKNMVAIPIPGAIGLDEEWLLRTEVIKNSRNLPWRQSEEDVRWNAWVDLERCVLPLVIRTPQKGDRIDPYGMHGAQAKVSDIFINRKIPQRFRRSYPVICDAARIIWLPGYTIADAVKVTDTTTEVLHLAMERNLEYKNA